MKCLFSEAPHQSISHAGTLVERKRYEKDIETFLADKFRWDRNLNYQKAKPPKKTLCHT